jgi:hypothetical protein
MNVRVILGLLEMNQVEAASLLGVSDRMLRYYMSGRYAAPLTVQKLLALLIQGKITRRDLALCLREPIP